LRYAEVKETFKESKEKEQEARTSRKKKGITFFRATKVREPAGKGGEKRLVKTKKRGFAK